MPTSPRDDLSFALKRFVKVVQESKNDVNMLDGVEDGAGREVLSAINRLIDERVAAKLGR